MSQPPLVYIHADESCLGNQFQQRANPGGAAGLVEHWIDSTWVRRDYWVSSSDTTNQRMALRSGINGLRGLKKPCRVRFVSDSQYLVKGMTEWLPAWKERGWKRKGGAIQNVELWRELDGVTARHQVRWEWIRGHAGHAKNEYANTLAVRAARTQTASLGLVESGFLAWLNEQRDRYEKYLDYLEFLPPEEHRGGA